MIGTSAHANVAVVTGAGGQLGQDVCDALREAGYWVFGFTRQAMDVTRQAAVIKDIRSIRPALVVHAAAYTKVDEAEQDADEAFRVNAYGARNVAMAAESCGAKLVYVSTDYVFSGDVRQPLDEHREPAPSCVYGRSKLAGERFAQQFSSRCFVVRTSWLYGLRGANFVRSVLRQAEEQDALRVVDDQIGSPTYTVDLAACILRLAETELYGTYHVSNAGHCSRYAFACRILRSAGLDTPVHPIRTERLPQLAPRPAFSGFDHMALRLNGFPPMRSWEEGLEAFLAKWREERGLPA